MKTVAVIVRSLERTVGWEGIEWEGGGEVVQERGGHYCSIGTIRKRLGNQKKKYKRACTYCCYI